MDSSVFFANPLNTVQLLSVYSHLNKLSDFFYTENIFKETDQYESIPIVNALYRYFDENDNDFKTKINLVHSLLAGSDQYGGRVNETIDSNYVDAVFDYIISEVVFKKYGNIFGFLASTMLTTNNVTLSFFKEEMRSKLLMSYYTNEDCSNSYLSELAVDKIMDQLILPLFPPADGSMSIVSPDYIYAQAGLSFARSAKMDLQNITFEELVEVSQTIESSVLEARMNNKVLSIFALPAILYYCHAERNLLRREKIEDIVADSDYWVIAYKHLFKYLDAIFRKLQNNLRKVQMENPVYNFKVAMSYYKTRSQLAEENLRLYCQLHNEGDYPGAINDYKNNPGNYYCQGKNIALPNINEIFRKQNEDIVKEYISMEKKLMKKAFDEPSFKSLEDQEIRIYASCAKYTSIVVELGFVHLIYSQKVKESVDLFESYISSEGKSVHYALIRENDEITLMSEEQDEFCEKIGLKKGSEFQRTLTILKYPEEPFSSLATRIAERRATYLKKILQDNGYEETSREKVMRIILSFIPFYNCINNIIQGKTTDAVMDCSLDALTLIPVYGAVMNIGFKIFSKTLLMTLGTSIRTFAFRESIYLSLRTLGKSVFSHGAVELSHAFTRETFKTISSSLLRSLDPGFELLGRLSMTGIKSTTRLLSLIKRQLSPPLYKKITGSLDKLQNSARSIKVGQFEGWDLYVDSYSGTNGFGYKYILTPSGKYEMRNIGGLQYEVPIKLEKVFNGKKIFRKVDPETGITYGLDLELKDDILQTVIPSLSERIKKIKTIGLSGRGAIAVSRKLRKLNKKKQVEEAVDIIADTLRTTKIEGEQAQKVLQNHVFGQEGKTELDFAIYWIKNLQIPPWISDLKLEESDLFWKLRFRESLSPGGISYNDAIRKIREIYTPHEIRDIGVDMDEVVEIFNNYDARVDLEFEDLYAILNYVGTGYRRIREGTAEARRMQNAFYRLAVRQADDLEKLPKFLYRAERRQVKFADSLTTGSVIDVNKFTSTSINEKVANVHLDNIPDDASIVPIIYEIVLDFPFVTADIYKLCPSNEEESILLPGVKLIIDKIEHFTSDSGKKVKKLFVRNLPVDKFEWLIQLMKRIKLLKESGTRFYSHPF